MVTDIFYLYGVVILIVIFYSILKNKILNTKLFQIYFSLEFIWTFIGLFTVNRIFFAAILIQGLVYYFIYNFKGRYLSDNNIIVSILFKVIVIFTILIKYFYQ